MYIMCMRWMWVSVFVSSCCWVCLPWSHDTSGVALVLTGRLVVRRWIRKATVLPPSQVTVTSSHFLSVCSVFSINRTWNMMKIVYFEVRMSMESNRWQNYCLAFHNGDCFSHSWGLDVTVMWRWGEGKGAAWCKTFNQSQTRLIKYKNSEKLCLINKK